MTAKEREAWRVAFVGVRKVVCWLFPCRTSRLAEHLNGCAAFRPGFGIGAEVGAWLTLEAHTAAGLSPADLLFVGGGQLPGSSSTSASTATAVMSLTTWRRAETITAGAPGRQVDHDRGAGWQRSAGCGQPRGPRAVLWRQGAPLTLTRSGLLTSSHVWRPSQRVLAIPETGGVHIHCDGWIVVGPGKVTPAWSNAARSCHPQAAALLSRLGQRRS
jgi:hypothetical protein